MAKYKNIRIKMKGGGSRLQRVQVLASGKYKFVKNKSRVSRKRKKTTTKRRVRRTARKKRRRSSRQMTVPIAIVGGLAAGMVRPAEALMAGNWKDALNWLAYSYAGIGQSGFEPAGLQHGLVPLIVGALVHKFVGGSLGVNRMLGQAKIPFIRI